MNAEFGPKDTTFIIAQGSPLTPPGGKVGGAEEVVFEQSAILSQDRTVGLVCPRPETNGKKLHIPNSLHVELYNSPSAQNNDELMEVLKQPKWIDYFRHALNGTKKGEGFLYGHYYVAGGVVAEMKDDLHRQFVYMGHSWDRVIREMDMSRHITESRDRAEQAIIRATDAIIVSTYAEMDMLAASYADVLPIEEIRRKTHVVPLGVDISIYNPEYMKLHRQEARKKLFASHPQLQDPNNLVFYTLGRMSPQKAHLEAIQAFASLYSQDFQRPMSLSVIGGPLEGNRYYEDQIYPYVASLPERIRSRIVIHDRQPAELAHAAGDVFVGASTWETWFLSLTEAMASGKACLVSDKPILREVAGDNIPLVDEADFNSLARSMYNFAVDTNYRLGVAQHAYRRGQRYTWNASVARLSLVLDNLQKGA